MSKEQLKNLLDNLRELSEEINAIPGSSGNGQLIDATCHLKSVEEHLKRYYALTGGKL